MDKLVTYSERIHAVYPELPVETARLHTRDGQFNDIVIIADELIFRFPRSDLAAAAIAREVALLSQIQPYLSLPIPDPAYSYVGAQLNEAPFMGYSMIPGEPLWNGTLASIRDETVLNRLATQLATFLHELHSVPLDALDVVPGCHGPDEWAELYQQICVHLFPYMRASARMQVSEHFTNFLNDPRQFAYQPTLCHADFGAGNILYDAHSQRITGVIDFDFACIGDPALDLAAVLSYGEAFVQRLYPAYPRLASMVERTAFYRGTYALQQALYALRDGDRESFDDGIAAYI